ncbi:MAG: hypothetical protein KC713_04640, partial [Candidatus Omnitrophica bacterium]|nr:hypothetical protein [Candidatus Omnitrophota bacterium]
MNQEDLKNEVLSIGIERLRIIDPSSEEVQLAVRYLNFIGRDDLASQITTLANRGLIKIGPIEGFLAALVKVDNKEYIIMSDYFEHYNLLGERVVNLVHEIGYLEGFDQTDQESRILEYGVKKWLETNHIEVCDEKGLEKDAHQDTSQDLLISDQGVEDPTESLGPKDNQPALSPEDSFPELSDDNRQEENPEGINTNDKKGLHKISIQAEKQFETNKDPSQKNITSGKMNLVNTLLSKKLITIEQLEDAILKQFGAKKPILELLIEMDFISEYDLMVVASDLYDMPIIDLLEEQKDEDLLKKFSYELLQRLRVFPIRIEDGNLLLATTDPRNVIALDDIAAVIDAPVVPVLSTISDIHRCLDQHFTTDDALEGLMNNLEEDDDVEQIDPESAEELLEHMERDEGQQLDIKTEEEQMDELPPQFKALLQESSPTVKL